MDIKINQKGFTWKEIVIVLAIGGVFALAAGLLLNNSQKETRDLKRLSDIQAIQHALELYFYDCNEYPSVLVPGGQISGAENCQGSVYLGLVPVDPKAVAYMYVPCKDDTIRDCSPGLQDSGGYQLYYNLESTTEGVLKGRHMAVPGVLVAE